MNRDITLRITADVILGVSIIFGWWWAAIVIGILCTWLFPSYWEIVGFAFIHDALFGMSRDLGVFGYIYVIVAVIILIVMHYIKLMVR